MGDVKAKKIAATGALVVGPARIKAISYVPAAGNITVRDGGAGGSVVLDFDTNTVNGYIEIPCNGIRCEGDPHVTLTTVTSATIFYG